MPLHWADPEERVCKRLSSKTHLCIEDHVDALVDNVLGMVAKEL